jgi:hypothetical protein
MKKLLGLMVVWLLLTFWLAYDNLQLKEFKEFNVHWRAFLVFDSTFKGCLIGAGTVNELVGFKLKSEDHIFDFCKGLSFGTKLNYMKKWENK